MDTDTHVAPRPAFQSWQLGLFAFPLIALAALALGLVALTPDYVSLLWKDPLGTKMLLGTAALVAVGSAVFLGGSLLVTRLVDRDTWGAGATVLQVSLAVAWVLSILPALFVVTIGPAALQIQRNLLRG
jgi:Flp pilus assembly protein TadB